MVLAVSRSWFLIAQQEAQQGPPPGSGFQTLFFMFSLISIFFLYHFLVQRPRSRQEQQSRQAMLKNLKKNDRVITTGGIYGVVTNVQADADEVTIRVDETTNTKLRMALSSVARVIGDGPGGEKESK